MAWLAFDIGCIECGETSEVIGVYASREKAQAAAEKYSTQDDHWGRPEWRGQHSCEVFPLPPITREA